MRLLKTSFYGLFLLIAHVVLSQSGQLGNSPWLQSIFFFIAFSLSIKLAYHTQSLSEVQTYFLIGVTPFLYLLFPASDDINRYIWESWVILSGQSPYEFAPQAIELSSLRDSLYWPHVNHQDLTAAYPPLVQLAFSGVIAVGLHPYWSIKVFLFLIFQLGQIGLIKALKWKNIPIQRILIWGTNPFVLIFLVGEAHLDILMITSLIWAFYFSINRKFGRTALLLGLSICFKYFTLIALPLFWNKNWKYSILYFTLPFVSFLFFDDIFKSLWAFGNEYHFNDFLFSHIQWLSGDYGVMFSILLIGIVLAFHTATEPMLPHNLLYTTLFLTCLLPTVHPWYLCLAMPWLVFYKVRSLLVLTVTCFIGLMPMYTQNTQDGIWQEFHEMQYFIWVPFIVMWVYELTRKGRDFYSPKLFQAITSVDIIVPIHNERDNLVKLHQKIMLNINRLQGVDAHLLYSHSGANDGCLEIAQAHSLPWITSSKPGRGFQIKQALEQSKADLIIIVHADTQFPEDHLQTIIREMNQSPYYYSGWCPMDFDHQSGLSLVRLLNSFRANTLQITFGDQMQFFRKEALAEYQEFLPSMPLMEDVEMAMKLKELGPSYCVNSPIKVSSRRWQTQNRWYNAFLIIKICSLYLFARRFEWAPSESSYFQNKYYGKSGSKIKNG